MQIRMRDITTMRGKAERCISALPTSGEANRLNKIALEAHSAENMKLGHR